MRDRDAVIRGQSTAVAVTSTLSTQPHLKAWSNIIPNANKRFVVLADFNNQAVLDRETRLVWERSPETTPRTWEDAVRTCWLRQVGGRQVGGRMDAIPIDSPCKQIEKKLSIYAILELTPSSC